MSRRPAPVAIRWEPELLGRLVAEALARPEAAGLRARYRRAAARLYDLDPDRREGAFLDLDLATAGRLDLERPVRAEIRGAGWPPGRVREVVLAPVTGAGDEGADLVVRPSGPRAVVRVRPSRFADARGIAPWLRHELGHVVDLLDPAFGYDGDRAIADPTQSEALVRERYRALWCASVDVRLHGWRRAPASAVARRIETVRRAFGLAPGDGESLLERLARGGVAHDVLVTCAREPARLAALCPGLRPAAGRAPRTRCPVCRFPTFPACPDARDLPAAVLAAVRADRPDWSPDDGLCARCREIYLLEGGLRCA